MRRDFAKEQANCPCWVQMLHSSCRSCLFISEPSQHRALLLLMPPRPAMGSPLAPSAPPRPLCAQPSGRKSPGTAQSFLLLPHPSLFCPAFQHSENRRELMFILVTPMSLSGVERLKELTRGKSQKRSESSSRSSSSYVASLSMRWWRWQVCSIFSLLMSLRRRMSCLASCWSCRRISA